ncbi:MAG: hypothetical protein GXO29_05740 [Thermotogae bacterium]|nr:hypothetical protein [Thermotogota bacterium]
MIYVLLSLDPLEMAGYSMGQVRIYSLGGEYAGQERDSVITTFTTGFDCVLPAGSRVVSILTINPDSLQSDTVYAYYNTFYWVEFYGKRFLGLLAHAWNLNVPVRSLRFPMLLNDRWPAYDWCGPTVGETLDVGFYDSDYLPDSAVLLPSYMSYTHISPDTDTIITSGLLSYSILLSRWDTLRYDSDTSYQILRQIIHTYNDFVHFTYVRGVGYVEYAVDSSYHTVHNRIYWRNGSLDGYTLLFVGADTSSSPRYVRRLEGLSVAERRTGDGASYTLNGDRLTLRCPGGCNFALYDAAGRRLGGGRLIGERDVSLRGGLLFLRLNGTTYKLLIR